MGSARGWTLGAAVAIAIATAAEAATYPPGFQETTVYGGLTQPTVVRFASDGRVFVAEKRGIVKVFPSLVDPTPTTFADIRGAVHDFWDRGLLGLALHPDFPATPYVYVLYTLNKKPGGTIPSWVDAQGNDICNGPGDTPPGPGATTDGCAVGARLSRLTASGNTMVPGSELVLIEAWCQQFPSHSIGSLHFGPEGALYVSGGEGGNFFIPDWGQGGGTVSNGQGGFFTPKNVCGDPPGGVGGAMTAPTAEGGALRAQSLRRASGPVLLNGAVLRLDPATGAGWPTNPLHASSDVNARRIVAYGLRNPFRFTIKPGTSEVWVGDVGWDRWEEINRVPDPTAGPVNFGWPCYEGGRSGSLHQSGYDSVGLASCSSLYAPGDVNVTAPVFGYYHFCTGQPGEPANCASQKLDHPAANDTCNPGSSSISGMAFYDGNSYPALYQGALFFVDYSRRCSWAMLPDSNGDPDPTNVVPFGSGTSQDGVVDAEVGPGGDLFFARYDTGSITRVQYFSAGNAPPTAVATADVTSGPLPLTVHFSGAGSTDPDGDTLTYDWDLDGNGSFETSGVSPQRTYAVAGPVTVRLRVGDGHGNQATTSLLLKPGNLPPTITGFAPGSALTWKAGDVIPFGVTATDPEDGSLPASAFAWSVILHHCPSNCHTHIVQTTNGVSGGTFTAPEHDYPSYLEIQVTATDSGGLAVSQSVNLQPQTVDLSFVSNPPGLSLGVNAGAQATPFTRTVIVGVTTALSAPSPQILGGPSYSFVSWSDGGAQNHSVAAPAAPTTYTATFSLPAPPVISIADAAAAEASGEAVFAVTLDVAPSSTPVTVHYATANGSAMAGSDYTATSGNLTFGIGDGGPKLVHVPVVGDARREKNEVFLVVLSGLTGGAMGRGQAQGVIHDDDSPIPDTCTPLWTVPIKIATPGLYCLGRSLNTAIVSGHAIEVAADGVTMDLKGFTLRGTAGASSQADGVYAQNRANVIVRNGTVQGFLNGVLLGATAPYATPQGLQVLNLHVLACTGNGIRTEGRGNRIAGNQVKGTTGTSVLGANADVFAIAAQGPGSLVSGNTVADTFGVGTGNGFGIALFGGAGGQATGNRVSCRAAGTTTGILARASTGVTVTGNRLSTLARGVVLDQGSTGTHAPNVFVGVATAYTGP